MAWGNTDKPRIACNAAMLSTLGAGAADHGVADAGGAGCSEVMRLVTP